MTRIDPPRGSPSNGERRNGACGNRRLFGWVFVIVSLSLLNACAANEEHTKQVDIPTSAASPAGTTQDGWTSKTRTRFVSTSSESATETPKFEPVPSLSSVTLAHRNGLAIHVSAVLEGGPVEFRVVRDGEKIVHPGPTPVRPDNDGASSTGMSFVWEGRHQGQCHTYVLEWRATTHDPVVLRSVTMVSYYQIASNIGCG
jgi:hypothetical protein